VLEEITIGQDLAEEYQEKIDEMQRNVLGIDKKLKRADVSLQKKKGLNYQLQGLNRKIGEYCDLLSFFGRN
jgi:hypothetical protein